MVQGDRRHRSIPDLIGDTFGVVRRRVREIAVIAIVAAATAVIAIAAFTAGGDIISDEILENPRFEEFIDLLTGDDAVEVDPEAVGMSADDLAEWTPVYSDEVRVIRLNNDDARSEAWKAFWDSVSWNRVVRAGLLIAASLMIMLLSWATMIAFSLVALDDVEGRPSSVGRAFRIGCVRVPKAVLLLIIYAAMFVALSAGGGYSVFALSQVHTRLGLAAFVAYGMVGVYASYLMLLAPLHFAMAYLEPGFPSFGRWWRLLGHNKALTFGRAVLVLATNYAVALILWLGWFGLPSPYVDFISSVIVWPILGALSSIALVLMYADLSGRSQPADPDWPELGT